MEKLETTVERAGGYRVVRRLETGRTDDVLLAKAEGPHGFERTVLLKRVCSQHRNDGDFAEIVAREASACARLSHPSIVRLFDFFVVDEQVVMVLEYVEGPSLERLQRMLCAIDQPLDDRAAIHVAARIFEALGAAHTAYDQDAPSPVIHRNVNPSNVLVAWTGHVKVTDFGIAKVQGLSPVRRAALIEGHGFLAPEQVRGEDATTRADVYAGGVILWELLTRKRAFNMDALPEVERLRQMAAPTLASLDVLRPDIDRGIREAVRCALEPDAAQRTVSADEMVGVLRQVVSTDGGREHLARVLATVRQLPTSTGPRSEPPAACRPSPRRSSIPDDGLDGLSLGLSLDDAIDEILDAMPKFPQLGRIPVAPLLMKVARPEMPLARSLVTPFVPDPAYVDEPESHTLAMPVPVPMTSTHASLSDARSTTAPMLAYGRKSVVGLEEAAALSPNLPQQLPYGPPPTPYQPNAANGVWGSTTMPAQPTAPPRCHPPPNLPDSFASPAAAPLHPSRVRLLLVGALLIVVLVAGAATAFSVRRRSATAAMASSSPATALQLPSITIVVPRAVSAVPAAPDALARAASIAAPPAEAAAAPDAPAGMGRIATDGASPGHRVFVDEKVIGETPHAFLVKCGSHVIKVGSSGRSHGINVPCGGTIVSAP